MICASIGGMVCEPEPHTALTLAGLHITLGHAVLVHIAIHTQRQGCDTACDKEERGHTEKVAAKGTMGKKKKATRSIVHRSPLSLELKLRSLKTACRCLSFRELERDPKPPVMAAGMAMATLLSYSSRHKGRVFSCGVPYIFTGFSVITIASLHFLSRACLHQRRLHRLVCCLLAATPPSTGRETKGLE